MHNDNIRNSNSIDNEQILEEQNRKMKKSESYDSDSNKSKKSSLSESSSAGEIKKNLKKKKESYNNRNRLYDKRKLSRERTNQIDTKKKSRNDTRKSSMNRNLDYREKKRDISIEYGKKYTNSKLKKHIKDSSYSDENSDSQSIEKRYSNNSIDSEYKKRHVKRKHSHIGEREKDNNSDYEYWNNRRFKNKKEKLDGQQINIRDIHEREIKGKFDYKYKRFEKENRSKNNYKDSCSKNRYNDFYDGNKKHDKDNKNKYRKYDDNVSEHDKRKTSRYDNSSDEYFRKEKKKSFKDSNERNGDKDDKYQNNYTNDEYNKIEYYENNNNNSKNDKEMEKPNEKKNITSDNNVREGQNFNPSGLLAQNKDYKNGVELKYTESIDSEFPDKKWRLYVFLNTSTDEPHEILRIHEKPYYLIGKDELVADIILRNISISKQHAVIQFKKHENKILPFLIDLNSTNGSYLNNEKIDPNKFYELRETDLLRFGSSGREYVLLYDSYEAPTNE
ncbi:fork head domain protein, putative [Plasmodium berghei]|uniref:FHA domain-containing protein, putative n=2 Tax=Plasmodium berghei TaxID=5821 RepID=A0A509ATK2_PLABA|nr:FHA domain-containing protein, putative [Plasmodium berghei ANKA]CXJ11303.1 fork head domain protein, putative [Plasmodium berghei]SCM26012.1 fork head domain protein, putative [Plasmodium berghei]SCN28233.1 fork head domain protein, putative [Plasmodium berghei]SCO62431.1 fork head domain protein, putative [Plasmodium berghei]SCO63989.1 fork head domain protein, putative [Plasmodium berghei]|eukprot:XP_034423885.1 FHA domain-containing protein, putative [Plasmodium berghei ANKA]